MRVKGFSDIQPSRNHVFTHKIYFPDVVVVVAAVVVGLFVCLFVGWLV